MKKPILFRAVVVVALLLLVISLVVMAAPTPPPAIHAADDRAIQQALNQSVAKSSKDVPALIINDVQIDHIRYAKDSKTALVWLAMVDRQTRKVLATEPGLALGTKTAQGWQITLPGSREWGSVAKSLPSGLLNKAEQERYLPKTIVPTTEADEQVFTGYYLPWEGGKTVWLTGSVAHFTTYMSCSIETCRYAFDFSDGTMFALLASKGGTVLGWKDTCYNGDPDCLNYIAIEDITTSPVTTQLYLHLAYNSIPAAIKKAGAPVAQGSFIGNTDDTGLSTGHHLHFMVVANRWYVSTSYGGFWWGNSVDIVFKDVDINGGRPRLCSEVYYTPEYGTECHPKNIAIGQYYDNWFISGNRGTTPPTGSLQAPAPGTEVTGPSVTVTGTGVDNTGVSKLQIAVNYDGTWKAVGPQYTTNPFTANLDLCAAGIPNGPVTLGLYVWDVEGNRSITVQDPRPILKSYTCPSAATPVCSPTENQVALYTETDFRGVCQTFNVGNYSETQLGAVGTNKAVSLQVGANVMATLFDGNYVNGVFNGRGDAFLASDYSLSDNRIGIAKASSLQVKARAKPSAPYLWPPYNKIDATTGLPVALNSNDSVTLVWKGQNKTWVGDEGGTEYSAELTLPGGTKRTLSWQTANSWSVGSLVGGTYTWTVTARNSLGSATSAPATFIVNPVAPLSGTLRTLPYSDNMETTADGWIGAALWKLSSSPIGTLENKAWVFNDYTDYEDSKYTGGVLISPPLAIPAGGAWLRFAYFNETEGSGPYWDQRRVQVAEEGGLFADVYQLSDDAQGEWKKSPAISLAAYAGKNIRIRFYFHVIDRFDNLHPGWRVDEVSVNTTPPDLTCAETVPDNTPTAAVSLAVGGSVEAAICPAGDMDVYTFKGEAGQQMWIETTAQRDGSSLDSYLYLIDPDGKSVLAEVDDIQLGIQRDSQLSYILRRSGNYFIKIRDYNHPGAGGPAFTYTLDVKADNAPPTVSITYPAGIWLPNKAVTLVAQAADAGGVTKVEFFWHSTNWTSGAWESLGADITASDGWKAVFDPTGRTIPGSALAVKATDSAGQSWWAGRFNLVLDTTPPTLTVTALPASTRSTAVLLSWVGADVGAGIEHYEIQVSDNNGAWVTWKSALPATVNKIYYLGLGGHTYQFRMKAVDAALNVRDFPLAAETYTALASTCTPDIYDASGGDNTQDVSSELVVGMVQQHNFCQNDVDWVRFGAEGGQTYLVRARSLKGGAAVSVSITNADGSIVWLEKIPYAFGVTNDLKFTAPATGIYKLHLRPVNSGLWGTDVLYAISVGQGSWLHLPLINR